MKLYKRIDETIENRSRLKLKKTSLGLVPTMGALHEGHLSLVRQAKRENQVVAVSIFVNPIQFNNPTDLEKYPRNLEKDLALLSDLLEAEDFVFAPEPSEIYPDEVTKKYHFGSLEKVMEGEHRPGHFNGVGIVVDRLFQIIEPSSAYFGEKDFQQLVIIQELVKLESHPIKIVPCQIFREPDGLAMSSRNQRLLPKDRENANQVYGGLCEAKKLFEEEVPLKDISSRLTQHLNAIPNFKVEYISFGTEEGLEIVTQSTNKPIRCFIAVFAGEVRLIDNLPMY